jgi:hypothetical protein
MLTWEECRAGTIEESSLERLSESMETSFRIISASNLIGTAYPKIKV